METEKQSTCHRCDAWMCRNEGPLCIDCRLYDAAILREVYDRAFYAALTSGAPLDMSHHDALEAVRTHATRMAELERVIVEGVDG